MLSVIIIAVTAIVCSVFALYLIDAAVRSAHNDWSARADRDSFEEPAEKLSVIAWIIPTIIVALLTAGSVALFQFAKWTWVWAIPAVVVLAAIIFILARVNVSAIRTAMFFMMVPFAAAIAAILNVGVFSFIGWFGGILVLVLLANIWRTYVIRTGRRWWVLPLVIVIIAGLAFGAIALARHIKNLPEEKPEETSVATKEADDAMKQTLTIDLNHEDLVQEFPNWDGKVWYNQFMSQAQERTTASGFSDAVDFPFKSETDSARVSEIQQLILHSPIYADMVARGVVDIKLSTGDTIGTLNPWLKEFIATSDKALKDKDVGWAAYMVWKDKEHSALYLTDAYFDYAARLAVLIGQLKVVGVEEGRKSSLHFCLPLIEDNAIIRTQIVTDERWQEDKPAFVLAYARKDARGEELIIGFNMLDKRFEMFAPTVESHQQKETETSQTEQKKTDETEEQGGSDDPGSSSEETKGTKSTKADAVNQDHADKGGGDNKSKQAGGFQAEDPAPDIGVVTEGSQSETKQQESGSDSKTETDDHKESVRTDENKPESTSFVAPPDSHDTEESNAGEDNGEFYMP